MTRLSEARAALAASRCTAVFSGAGLSAESGIATFRGNDGHALWSQFNPMELASAAGFEDNPARVIEEAIDLAQPPPLRPCPHCGAPMRPAVVWFGEGLPQRIWNEAQRICSELDCLLVVGTSATVYPAASLIEDAAAAGSKIISVNTEPSGAFGAEHIELVGPASVVLPQLLEGLSELGR